MITWRIKLWQIGLLWSNINFLDSLKRMIATGSVELIFYDSVNNSKFKSADIKIDKMKWSYSSNCFLLILSDGKLYIWHSLNASDCTQLNISNQVVDFDLTKDDSYIVYTSNDKSVRVYDIKRQKQSSKEYLFTINASNISLSADDVVIAVFGSNSVEILNRTSKEYKKIECAEPVLKMQWSYQPTEIFELYIMTSTTLYMLNCMNQTFTDVYRNVELRDFCLSNTTRVLYIYGSELVKYNLKDMAIVNKSVHHDANCIYFDDDACFLYIGYQHGILKLAANLEVIESISLVNSTCIATKSNISNAFEIPRIQDIFTPPRQTTDSAQNLRAMENGEDAFTTPYLNDAMITLEDKLETINQEYTKRPDAIDAESAICQQINDLRQELKGDLVNIHVELIKQIHQQKVIIFY